MWGRSLAGMGGPQGGEQRRFLVADGKRAPRRRVLHAVFEDGAQGLGGPERVHGALIFRPSLALHPDFLDFQRDQKRRQGLVHHFVHGQ